MPRGRILNTLACAKNVDILTKKNNKPLKAFCVLSKATVMHIRTQDVLGGGGVGGYGQTERKIERRQLKNKEEGFI